MTFDRLPAVGPVASALVSACDALGVKPIVWKRFERAALERRPDDDYVKSTLCGKHFRDLQRKGRKLERELGDIAFVDRAVDPRWVSMSSWHSRRPGGRARRGRRWRLDRARNSSARSAARSPRRAGCRCSRWRPAIAPSRCSPR